MQYVLDTVRQWAEASRSREYYAEPIAEDDSEPLTAGTLSSDTMPTSPDDPKATTANPIGESGGRKFLRKLGCGCQGPSSTIGSGGSSGGRFAGIRTRFSAHLNTGDILHISDSPFFLLCLVAA